MQGREGGWVLEWVKFFHDFYIKKNGLDCSTSVKNGQYASERAIKKLTDKNVYKIFL